MRAREYFERLLDVELELQARRRKAQSMRETLGSKSGTSTGSIGGTGKTDGMADVDHVIEYEMEIERDQAKHDLELSYATDVLYGRSGRGGLAKARRSVDADILCCHYLQGMSYAEIADEIAKPDSNDPVHWCIMRARRALDYIDTVGMHNLSNS